MELKENLKSIQEASSKAKQSTQHICVIQDPTMTNEAGDDKGIIGMMHMFKDIKCVYSKGGQKQRTRRVCASKAAIMAIKKV